MLTTPNLPGNDKDIVVIFRHDKKQDKEASKKAGRPIFRDIELCEMRFPADRNRIGVHPAHEVWKKVPGEYGLEEITYAMRFSEQYKRFKANTTQIQEGTPLEELTFITAAKRSELKALNIHTADQLAHLDGQPLSVLGMGGRELKDQAIAYLEAASGSAVATAQAAEIAALKEQIRLLSAAPRPSAPVDELDAMEDAALKALIKEKTGAAPRGTPSHATLVTMAREASAQTARAA